MRTAKSVPVMVCDTCGTEASINSKRWIHIEHEEYPDSDYCSETCLLRDLHNRVTVYRQGITDRIDIRQLINRAIEAGTKL